MQEKFEKKSIEEIRTKIKEIEFKDIKNDEKIPIIFDTNFLFVTFQFNIDIIDELIRLFGNKYQLFIYEGTIKELSNLEKKKTKNKMYIPLIAKMLQLYNFQIIKSNKEYIDEQILDNVKSKIIIATNDKLLRLEIKKNGGKVLFLRQKKYLELM